ncbi:MAG: TetR/AcrR family transcriptional regulator [Pseudomonadota bacterium]
MGRPSLNAERREQILAAFEKCVAERGVDGATLERIAEEAGVARALIRHNVGNKDDLLDALVARFLERTEAEMAALAASLPSKRRVQTLVDWLFDPAEFDDHATRLSEALIDAATTHPALAEPMRQWTEGFVAVIERVIREEHPGVRRNSAAAVATGITGIYFNVTSLATLGGMPRFFKASKTAADLLIQSLEADRV